MKNHLLRLAIAGFMFSASTAPVVAFAAEENQIGEPVSEQEASISNTATVELEAGSAQSNAADEPKAAGDDAGVQPELPLPTFYALDAETGKPIVGVRVKIVVRNAVTGEALDSTEESVGIQSGGLSEDLYKYLQNSLYSDWKENFPEPISFEVETVAVPLAYQQSDASGSVTETSSGWQASGDLREIAPNVFALTFTRATNPAEAVAAQAVGTQESPLISEPNFSVPRFVLVDRNTGEVVNGSFWSGQMCQRGEGTLSCWSLDQDRITFSGNGESVLSDDYEWVAGRTATLTLRNMQAPARCKLIDEEVNWRWIANPARTSDTPTGQAEAWGAGIFKYYEEPRTEADSFTFAESQLVYGIPVDCNPAPVCTAADLPSPEVSSYEDPAVVEATNRYTSGPTDLYPSIFVLARNSSAVLPNTIWNVEIYARSENSDAWYQVEDTEAPVTDGVDGQWYSETISIPTDAAEFYVVARQLQAPLGYVPSNQTYVFHGVAPQTGTQANPLWDWTATEGALVTLDQESSELTVDYSGEVTDPAERKLLPYGTWAFAIVNATVSGDECAEPEPSAQPTTSELQQPPIVPVPIPVPAPYEVPTPNAGGSVVGETSIGTTVVTSPPAGVVEKQDSRGILANTGANVKILGLFAALLLSVGGLLVLNRTREQ